MSPLVYSHSGMLSTSLVSLAVNAIKTVLVTGGAGFIGSHTVLELLNAGYEVVVVDNFSNSCYEALNRVSSLAGRPIDVHAVDILDQNGLFEVFNKYFDQETRTCSIDAVIHFAGLKAVGESVRDPLDYYHNNVSGTLSLLKMMEIFGVHRMVFSSSATVYGDCPIQPIHERCPLSTMSPYGRTKLFNEQIIEDWIVKVRGKAAILRYFNPIGAHPSGMIGEDPQGIPNNLMPYMAQVAVGVRKEIQVFGTDYLTRDGTGVRDYVHVMDLANGHKLALERMDDLLREGEARYYNLGTGLGFTVLEMIAAFASATQRPIPYTLADRRPGDVPVLIAQVDKAKEELGFTCKYGLKEMCEHLWNWQSKHPHGYRSHVKALRKAPSFQRLWCSVEPTQQ